ncbi:FAD-binding oxidoreductase [Pseudomonas sp. J452]|uniref:FAD-binding oxidoreductase n=1 Tax=Pseudomonas sp. J452 TaxID=2898441 RepID=UPI0021AD7B93|nr:FAD-binding oxidoreductase [Pseudomonas sp. J452]UUY08388.1 FAD-binding oxidoreductase [Pseudomonas sp. J452]
MKDVIRPAQVDCVQASLVERTAVNDSIVTVKMQLHAGDNFQYQPGQYAILLNDQDSYPLSIASIPNEENILEFHIKIDKLSFRNRQLHELLTNRDKISIQGPFGSCVLNVESQRTPIFVAIGLGISQIKGLLEYALRLNGSGKCYLLWSARSEHGLYLDDYWRDLQSIHPNFEYVPVLSRPETPDWWGQVGYVQDILPDIIGHRVDSCDIYVAGGKQSVESVVDMLLQSGVKARQLHYDRW